MIVSWICFLSLKRRWSKEAFHRFGSKIDSGSAMYIQPPSPVSISQKYWRLFLRKVNMAFEEMCSPKKYWIHTNCPKLSFFVKTPTLKKNVKGAKRATGVCANLHNWILSLFPHWTTSHPSGFLLPGDIPGWEDLKVSLSASRPRAQGCAKLSICSI